MTAKRETIKSFRDRWTSSPSSYPTKRSSSRGLPLSSTIFKIISTTFKQNSSQPGTNCKHQASTRLFMQKLRRSWALEVNCQNPSKLGSIDERNNPAAGKRMPVLQIPKRTGPSQKIGLLLHRIAEKQLNRARVPCQWGGPLKRQNGATGVKNRRKQQKKSVIMPIPPRNPFLIIHQSFKTYQALSKIHEIKSYQIQYFHGVGDQQFEIILS